MSILDRIKSDINEKRGELLRQRENIAAELAKLDVLIAEQDADLAEAESLQVKK